MTIADPTFDETVEMAVHAPEPERRALRPKLHGSDRVFVHATRLAGILVLVIIGAIGLFLAIRGSTAISRAGFSFLTTQDWQPDRNHFGIAGVLTGTMLIALVAVTIATPIALGTALFITEVAQGRTRRMLVSTVDLMAAVPSVVFAVWGKEYLQTALVPVARWLATWLGWIPFLHVDAADLSNPLASRSVFTASTFVVGCVVALMVMPIQCVVMRECFSQAPLGEREGATALGATRFGLIRTVVLPFGRGGIIGGTMLGLGRALGETIVVYLIISPVARINWNILESGGHSVSALIALQNGDASTFGTSALMAAGLSLFVLTLVINFTAGAIVARSRSGAQSEV
jgi:phosphate transport system permease protein